MALVFLAVVWGYSWVAIKVATLDASPLALAALRATAGATALLLFLAISGRSLRPPPFLPTLAYGLLQTTGFSLVQTTAVAQGGAGKSAILAYTMPFWLALLAWPLLGDPIAGLRWLSLGLAAAGLLLVVWPLDARALPADALAVLAGLIWAASAVLVIRLRRGGRYDLLALTTWQMVWGALALGAVALFVPGHVRLTPRFVAAIAFLSIVVNAVGWALWLFILSRLPPATAGIASLATPVMGIAFSALQLREVPSRTELAGIALIVVALAVNARSGRTR
jgi:drug/metabolite transporter (DMT)-like permease